MREQEYLGDGVYASFDGYHVWLETTREYGVERIALEPVVMQALMKYYARWYPSVVKRN